MSSALDRIERVGAELARSAWVAWAAGLQPIPARPDREQRARATRALGRPLNDTERRALEIAYRVELQILEKPT